jgi:hypothetical protein
MGFFSCGSGYVEAEDYMYSLMAKFYEEHTKRFFRNFRYLIRKAVFKYIYNKI